MDLSYDDVHELLKIIDASTVEELHLEVGEFKLVVRKRVAAPTEVAISKIETPLPAVASAQPAAPRPEPARTPPRAATRDGVEVKAPMVGTFYRAPAPGAPPFVEVGSVVAEDDTVCIIEVMKLMNSIRAGCRGRVVEICADDAALVEFGQTLMVIEPLA